GAGRPEVVLIDGYNLLHAIPRFAPRGAEVAPARAALEGWIAQACRRHRVRDCLVIWDGGGARRARAPAPLTVLYTPEGVSADERLLDLCRSRYASRAGSTWVVSSDRGVQAPARELGFTVLGARTFYERWKASGSGKARGRSHPSLRSDPADESDPKPRASKAEVEELLPRFLDAGRPATRSSADGDRSNRPGRPPS
ncbi:MAG TPA: NYN domain-containing protein, partial [Gemmatimonadota bacterium]|nr:NYN domain-containing protein [Gemmatimonadota bacterium]